jgi:hypothetical protein
MCTTNGKGWEPLAPTPQFRPMTQRRRFASTGLNVRWCRYARRSIANKRAHTGGTDTALSVGRTRGAFAATALLVTAAVAELDLADPLRLLGATILVGLAWCPQWLGLAPTATPFAAALLRFGVLEIECRYHAEPDSRSKSGPEQAATRGVLANMTNQPIKCGTVHGFLPISAALPRRPCRRRASRLVFNILAPAHAGARIWL